MTAMLKKQLHIAATLICLTLLTSGFMATNGCQTTPITVAARVGPQTTKLIEEQKDQLQRQKDQLDELKKKDEDRKKQLDQVAGSAHGIDVGVSNIKDDSKGKNVVVAENGLIKSIVGDPSPEEKAKADARTISILQNDLATQKKLYGDANIEINNLKNDLSAKDKVIADRDDIIKNKNKDLFDQETRHNEEVKKTADDTQKIISGLQTSISNLKNEQVAKERSLWINTLRYGGLAVIFLGIATLAISQGRALWPGLILIGSGSLVIAIGVAINIIISQVWFPIAAFIVGLLVIAGVIWAGLHFWQTHKNGDKTIALLNDMKTEAETLAQAGDEKAKALLQQITDHATYRFGGLNKLESLFTKTGLDEKQKS